MRILEVRKDGSLVVSGRGLRRIVSQPGNQTILDFVRLANAGNCIAIHDGCYPNGERWAEAITYREVYRRSRRQRAAG